MVIRLIHGRYDWFDYAGKFSFEGEGAWTLEDADADRALAKEMRRIARETSWTLTGKPFESDNFAALRLCIEAARIVFSRYDWKQFANSFNFPNELSGDAVNMHDTVIKPLTADYNVMYDLRQQFKRNSDIKAQFGNAGEMMRVASAIEGLLFHAIRSVSNKFHGKRAVVGKHTRALRCLEGLFFQLCKTSDPDYRVSGK